MAATGSSGSVRLIAGQWRGRKLPIVDVEGLRPTGDRVKETLFNWLQTQIPGARCLDLFAGSGSLGFEAASRGAAEVIMVERDPTVVGCLQASAERLSAAQVTILQTDAAAYLQTSPDPFDIVFLDPPFNVGNHIFSHLHACLLRESRLLFRPIRDRDHDLVEQAHGAMHEIGMSVGNGVKCTGINGNTHSLATDKNSDR